MVSLQDVKSFKHRINPTEEIEGRANFGYYVVRPLSLYLTWLVLQTKMTANQVTVLHMVVGIIGAALFGFADLWLELIGALLLYLSYIIDNVDGEVARFRKQVSITGKYLDTAAHTIVIMLMFFGYGFGTFLRTGQIELIVLGFLAGFFSLRLDLFTMYMEAAKSAESHLDKNYEYYANVENQLDSDEDHELQYISKRANNPLVRFLFAVFAYPGILHVMTLAILFELTTGILKLRVLPFDINVLVVYMYGTLLPIRRFLTYRRLVVNHETERVYLKLSRESETKEKVTQHVSNEGRKR